MKTSNFHYYCLDLENREVFYRWIEAIFEILKVFNDNGLIAFAFHKNERLILHKFRFHTQNHKLLVK